MKRPIAISLAPNLEFVDVLLALKLLFSPLSWFDGGGVKMLEQWFRQYFLVSYAISFASGRGALFSVLKSIGVGNKDEVLLQTFTCVAVPSAVTALYARPVYVDIDKTFNMDVLDMEKKISKKTKAIIAQHTYGIPANIEKIKSIAKKHQLFLIEDCAHTIGGIYKNLPAGRQGKKLGNFGDAAIFSFGRDKAFSSVFGGMAITNNKELGEKIRQFQKNQGFPNMFWVFQQLCHPLAFLFILPLYNVFSLGKVLLFILQKIRFLSFPVLPAELQGKIDGQCMKKMPNSLAELAFLQLKRLDKFNIKRKELAKIYQEALGGEYKENIIYLRYPFLVKKRDALLGMLKKNGIYLGKWYSEIIDPKGTDFNKVFYQTDSCPNAEIVAKSIINLPTYPTLKTEDAKKIASLVKQYVTKP